MKENPTEKDRLGSLYGDLAKYGSLGEYEKALSTAHKILNLNPDEYEAYMSVIVALIRLERFEDALKFMDSQERKYGELIFHKSYVFYRLNRPNEALESLKKMTVFLFFFVCKVVVVSLWLLLFPSYAACHYKRLTSFLFINRRRKPDLKCKELEAQILYRLERYAEALSVYESMDITKEDEFISEREANICAVKGCCYIADDKYSEAEKCLKKAESMCKALLKEEYEDIDEDELQKETGIINVQMGFALQLQGKVKEAHVLYNQVLKTKPSDIGLVAVASNNLITLNKDQNIFDSRKRIKAATVEGLEHKLTSSQRRSIAYNSALLAMYTNQIEACKVLIEELDNNFGLKNDDEKDLILAGVLSRSGKYDEAIKILMSTSVLKLDRLLISVQLLLEKKDFKGAIKLLEEKAPEEIKYKKLLAVAYNSKNKKSDKDMSIVWKKTAEFHLCGGELTVAAQSLEELLKTNPNDHILLAQLLPEFKEVTLDVNALESTAFFGGNKKVPKVGGLPSPVAKKENVDLPDPERWIPKKERIAYRKHLKRERRNKGEKFTGAQGTAQGQSDNFDYSSKKATPKSPATQVNTSTFRRTSATAKTASTAKEEKEEGVLEIESLNNFLLMNNDPLIRNCRSALLEEENVRLKSAINLVRQEITSSAHSSNQSELVEKIKEIVNDEELTKKDTLLRRQNVLSHVRAELEHERRIRTQEALDEAERRCYQLGKELELKVSMYEEKVSNLESTRERLQKDIDELGTEKNKLTSRIRIKEDQLTASEIKSKELIRKANQFEELFNGQLESVKVLQNDLTIASEENKGLVKEMELLNKMFYELERTHVTDALKNYKDEDSPEIALFKNAIMKEDGKDCKKPIFNR
ncbi:SRP72 [Lepeophtheirus salmonis]|uniref:SRP72 n=1 Tax=Lepeophtheirus salmonis TaxID=72036 RepID=A0A7R8CQE1_LEPSM|nr:SRP72 [Lepeophtheirus salmonis]CAF2892492.1 SRP72 [Lepeophtheirus salmonis]